MGKTDYSHDYYRDLELDSEADEADIKKQYKKLALLYHPDRNLGDEEAASKKFQRISAAAEVLLDPKERSKYDSNRTPRPTFHGGYTGASGVRGNPYADMASKANAKYGAPPTRAPPRSKGASNYDKFARATPAQSAFQAAQEGPEARYRNFDAWERMHHPTARADQSSFKSPKVPENFASSTSQSFRAESSSKRRPTVPPRASAFEDYREPNSSPRKHTSSKPNKPFPQTGNAPPPVPNRKGFMPNTPGAGDEPPAPRGAYFTQRDKPTAPPPPPREHVSTRFTDPDPLKQFKYKAHTVPDPEAEFSVEGRTSTPYASHGGERFNPFERASAPIGRSSSTKETKQASKGSIPRPGSDSNLKANGSRSSADPKPARRASTKPTYQDTIDISSSDDDFVTMNSPKAYGKRSSGASTERKVPETKGQTNTDGPPPHPDQTNSKNNQPNIFSFNASSNNTGKPIPRPSGFSNSEENISTKFASGDWDGKFSAGSGIFSPEHHGAGIGSSTGPPRQRSKSTTRIRQRSPTKSNQPMASPRGAQSTSENWAQGFKSQTSMPQTAEPQQMHSPEGTFSPNVWEGTFNPDTFNPPSQGPPPRMATNRRKPSLRPTMGGKAAVVDDNSTSDEQPPHFSARKEDPRVSPAPIPTPEPMDIDTPPTAQPTPSVNPTNEAAPKFNANNLHIDAEKVKQPSDASNSRSQNNSGAADALKVNFENLNIVELISTLDMPEVPTPPKFPIDIAKDERPTLGAYSAYQQLFAKYMRDWDIYSKKFLLHFVSRSNQNDNFAEMRWKDEEVAKIYRKGLDQDQVVRRVWAESNEKHIKAMKEWQIMKERMN